jgi:hypothetical protein
MDIFHLLKRKKERKKIQYREYIDVMLILTPPYLKEYNPAFNKNPEQKKKQEENLHAKG